jgi:hypothetical protein
MSRRTSPPFRADHVGSLLRPPRLLRARDDFAAGQITAAELRAVEDQEIPGAIKMQERFSSTVEGNALTREEQLAKLRLIVDVARDIWGD